MKDLQQILNLLNFQHHFSPEIAGVLKPLIDALCAPLLVRSAACEVAFTVLQGSAVVQSGAFLDPTMAISANTDASSTHVGSVLQQTPGATSTTGIFRQEIAYFSVKYSAFDREM